MDGGQTRFSRLSRRGFLGGVAASAAAAILAACGGSKATDTPAAKPTTAAAAPTTAAAAPTTAPAAATAAPAVATAPAASAAAAATKPAASAAAAGTTAPAGSAAAGGTKTAASTGPVGAFPPISPDKYKGVKLLTITRQEYFPDTQKAMDAELQNYAKQGGFEVTNDHVNTDDGAAVAKLDAAVKSGNSVDMQYVDRFVSQFTQLGDIIDVSDVVAEMQTMYGPTEDYIKNALFINGKWMGIPFFSNAGGWFVRKDWLSEKGIKIEDIKTYENARDIALQISDPSKNRFGWGLTVNQGGDANGLIEGCIQAYGGALNDDTGKKVTLNSPETVAAVTFLADIYTNAKYKNMLPPGVGGWNDTGNNEAWAAGTIGLTTNAFSLYAKSFADKSPIYPQTGVFPALLGPGTDRLITPGGGWGAWIIFKTAKNPDLAKEVAKRMAGGSSLLAIVKPSVGLVMPAYKKQWDSDPFYTSGEASYPSLRKVIETELPIATKTGFHFPQTPSPGHDQARDSAFIYTNMMADIITKGTKVPDAVKAAHDATVKIFEQLGIKQ
jgi:multiple sugar transport system substrate-binding protein